MSRRVVGFGGIVENGDGLCGCEGEGLTRGVFRELIEKEFWLACSVPLLYNVLRLTRGRLICRILDLRGEGL